MSRLHMKWWNRLGMFAGLLALFVVGGLLFATPKAHAAAGYNWEQYGGATYIIVTNNDHTEEVFDRSSYAMLCSGTGANYSCRAPRNYVQPNPAGGTLTNMNDDADIHLRGAGNCPPYIVFSGDSGTGVLHLYKKNVVIQGQPVQPCVEETPTFTVDVGNTDLAPSDLPDVTPAVTADANDPELECGPNSRLDFVLCPLVSVINHVVGALDDFINTMLNIDSDKIFNQDTDSGAGFYKAWSSFRVLSVAIIVLAGLIMVIAQSLGFEILDAYTIKKVVPRMLVAIIGIALSWYLMKFFVDLTNALGAGVRQLIYYPFSKLPGSISLGGGSLFIGALLGGTAFLALGVGGLLSFALTALLAILVAFLVLVVRQLVVLVLILFAPIAIACSILPNTQGVYKLWHESFTKALLMFPIIVGFIAIGRVFAIVAIGTDVSKAPAISQLIGFAAYFLPYFLIPLTFSLAGGAMRFVGGQINDRNRGAFDRLKKYRAGKVEKNVHAMKEGNRFRGNNMVARRFNKITQGAAALPEAGLVPWQMKSRYSAAQGAHAMNAAEEIRTKNPDFAIGAQDDRMLKAALHGKGRAGIRQYLSREANMSGAELDNAVGVVERMQATGSEHAVHTAAAMQLAATGTGYKNSAEMINTIAEVAGGDRVVAGRMLGTMRSLGSQSGRVDLGGAGYGVMSTQLNNKISAQEGGRQYQVDSQSLDLDALNSTDTMTFGRGRNEGVQNIARSASKRIEEITAIPEQQRTVVEQEELGRITASIQNTQVAAVNYAAPQRVETISKSLRTSEPGRVEVQEAAEAAKEAAKNVDPESGMSIAPSPTVQTYSALSQLGGFDARAIEAERQRQEKANKDGGGA